MATNGQLVFTDVDKVTFKGVGNTSNAVIDTTTGKIGVGVDSPDANLHVVGNCFVSTNFELGGTMTMGTVTVRAQHELSAITATGNTTPHTVEFQNATTGFVTTSNVGIGTNAPIDTLHINGGTRFAGHIIPTTNATFDIGSAENKVRDLYVDTNSIWVGDRAKIAFENGKMKFKRRKLNKVPRMLVNLAINHGRTDEADVETHAIAFAQTKDASISSVSDLKLEHLRDYAKTFDNTKAVSDIFADNDEDYEAITASEAFMEVGSNIFTEHSLSIGKTTDPTSALDVVGDTKISSNLEVGGELTTNSNVGVGTSTPLETLDVYGGFLVRPERTTKSYLNTWPNSNPHNFQSGYQYTGPTRYVSYSKNAIYTTAGGLKVSPPNTDVEYFYIVRSIFEPNRYYNVPVMNSTTSPYLSGDVFSSTRFKADNTEDFTGFAIGQDYLAGNILNDFSQYLDMGRAHSAHMYFKTASPDGTLTEKMRITNTGNVGIGEADPTEALHIYRNGSDPTYIWAIGNTSDRAGIAFSEDTSNKHAIIEYDGTGGGAGNYLAFYSDVSSWTSKGAGLNFIPSNGRVGVGTTSPEEKLHVQGQIRMTSQRAIGGTYNTYLNWPNSGHHIDCYKDGSAHDFHINHYAQRAVHLNRSSYSDRRIKEDIKDIDDVSALDTLRKIKPKTYKYKLQPHKGTVYGFIAQDVREVLPYATSLTKLSAPFDRENFVNATILEDGTVNLDGPCNELEIGKNASFYYESSTSTRDFEVTEIISPTQFSVRVGDDSSEWIGNTILVGKEVDDFHGIDKDAIFTVATAALQEVDRQQQADKVRISELETQLETERSRNDALEARILALENAS